MDSLIKKDEEFHSWILAKGEYIRWNGLRYILAEDTQVYGDDDPTKIVLLPPIVKGE